MMRAIFFFLLGIGVTLMSAQQPSNEAAINRGIFVGLQHIKDSLWNEIPKKDTLLNANSRQILPAIKKSVEDVERLRHDSLVLSSKLNLMREEYDKLANK
jgi:hypothetical protein